MAVNTVKPARRVGVGAQYICFHGAPAQNGTLSFEGDITKLKTVTSIELAEERSAESIYGSNEEYDAEVAVTPPTITVENLAFPPRILARMRGNAVSGGFVTHSTFDEGEYFAYGVVFPKKSGQYTYCWYPKCKLTSNTDNAQTKDGSSSNSQNRSTVIQACPYNAAGAYKVEYDTELLDANAPAVTEEEFFSSPLMAPMAAH